MMQDWFDALANARQLLRQGGQMALVDFYISRKYPARDRVRHGAISRAPSAERFGHYGLLATMYCRAPIICLI